MDTAPVSFEVWMDFKVLFRIDIRSVFLLSTANDIFAVFVIDIIHCLFRVFFRIIFFLFWQLKLPYCIFCFKTSCKVSSIFLLSIGFAICPFIPFSNAFFLSSSNALAVIAMIGIPAFFLSASLLIA